jgi:glycerophosphoryl diester phosphodiesterase
MPEVQIQGHRGARGLWPENTLCGFARALGLGVSALELDCAVSRDGVVVVTHDPDLNPDITRDASGRFLEGRGARIFDLSYTELQAYDVGRLNPAAAYAARFPDQDPADGERIPRLADVLTLVHTGGRGQVQVSVEVKTFPEQPDLTAAPAAFAAALREVVESTGTASMVSVMAFDWRVLTAMQRLMPQVARVALTEEQPGGDTVRIGAVQASPWLGGLDPKAFDNSVVRLVKASGAAVWGPDYLDLDAQRVAAAHALGLRVVPWTVNATTDMERLIDFGVDGMTTDRPDVLREVLIGRGLPVPSLSAEEAQR